MLLIDRFSLQRNHNIFHLLHRSDPDIRFDRLKDHKNSARVGITQESIQ